MGLSLKRGNIITGLLFFGGGQVTGIKSIRFHDLRHTHATLLLSNGVHPKIVQERLGHGSIAVTIDTYSHVIPGLQEMAAQRIENIIGDEAMEVLGVEKGGESMLASVGKEGEFESEPHRNRTCNLLIKSQLLCQLS